MVLLNILYLTEYHLFFSQLYIIIFFFNPEKISKKFVVPAVTIRKMHGRKVGPFYRVANLTGVQVLEANHSTVSCTLLH